MYAPSSQKEDDQLLEPNRIKVKLLLLKTLLWPPSKIPITWYLQGDINDLLIDSFID